MRPQTARGALIAQQVPRVFEHRANHTQTRNVPKSYGSQLKAKQIKHEFVVEIQTAPQKQSMNAMEVQPKGK